MIEGILNIRLCSFINNINYEKLFDRQTQCTINVYDSFIDISSMCNAHSISGLMQNTYKNDLKHILTEGCYAENPYVKSIRNGKLSCGNNINQYFSAIFSTIIIMNK